MSDYSKSKGLPPDGNGKPGNIYPENSTESIWQRVEPLITPELLQSRHLIGISMLGRFKDPATGKPFRITPEILQDIILASVDVVEEECKIIIMPTKFSDKLPFDRAEYGVFGYMRMPHRPIYSLDSLTISPANNSDIYTVPLDWVSTEDLGWGKINIVPLTLVLATGGLPTQSSGGGALFMSILASKPWVPSYWRAEYTAGFKDGLLPRSVNRLVGIVAAIDVLSQLAAANSRSASASLSLDGMSQSTSTEGSRMFMQRIAELTEERKLLTKRTKRRYGMGIGFGNV